MYTRQKVCDAVHLLVVRRILRLTPDDVTCPRLPHFEYGAEIGTLDEHRIGPTPPSVS